MNLFAKVAYNTIAQIISKVIATALGLFSIALITRYLGQTGFGQYTTVLTFLSFFAVLADLGLTLVTVQMISCESANKNKILNNLFTARFFSIILFLALAPIVLIFTPYDAIVKIGIIIAALSFFFPALNQILIGLFQKELRMDKASIAEVLGRVFLLFGYLLAVKLNWGLWGILGVNVFASFINFAVLFYYSRDYVRIKFEFDKDVWREIFTRSWPLAITIAFNLIYLRADILILSLINTQAEVGIYGAAYRVVDVLVTVPFMFAGIVLPILTFNWLKKNKEAFKIGFQKSFDFMVMLAIPFVVGAQFLAEPVMRLVAGEDFSVSGSVLKILALATGFIYFGVIFSHAIIALEKQKSVIGAYVFVSLSALVAYLIFIPKYSYIGAAWVTVYSEIAIMLFMIYYVWKFSGFLPGLKNFGKSLVASALMAGFIALIPSSFYYANWGLIMTLLSAVVFYFGLQILIGGITKRDISSLFNK